MKLDYNSREIFFGNEALIVADMAKGLVIALNQIRKVLITNGYQWG